MNEGDWNFLMELLTCGQRDQTGTELAFIHALDDDPSDKAARAAYSDYLREQGRIWSADAVAGGYYRPMRFAKSKHAAYKAANHARESSSVSEGVVSGALLSGQISSYHLPRINIASGSFSSLIQTWS